MALESLLTTTRLKTLADHGYERGVAYFQRGNVLAQRLHQLMCAPRVGHQPRQCAQPGADVDLLPGAEPAYEQSPCDRGNKKGGDAKGQRKNVGWLM